MELDPTTAKPVLDRLKRAHGHLGKVIAMMEEGADCESLMTQLAAVDKAITRAGYAMVSTGLQQCLAAGPDGSARDDVQRMERLFLGFA